MPQNLNDTIRQNAKGPARASGDSGSMQQHGLREQIEADRDLTTKTAVSNRRRGLRFNKLVPPGAS